MKLSYKQVGILAACAVLVGLLLYSVYTSIDRSNKISLEIDFVPNDAAVYINERKVGRGTIYLDPGTYKVTASRDGFSDFVDSSLIVNNDSPKRFYAIKMRADSDEARKWLADNQEAVNRITKLGYKALDERNVYLSERNPITKHLPYKNFLYSIGHHADPANPDDIIIDIDAPEGYRQAALYKIRELGDDPTDLNIVFREYENPFPL